MSLWLHCQAELLLPDSRQQLGRQAQSQPGARSTFPGSSFLCVYHPPRHVLLPAGLYKAKDWTDAIDKARSLVLFGGHGHTSCLYTRPTNKEHITEFREAMETVRILINSPASQGAIGDLYNFHLDPSLTLGCGSWGSTSVSANVGPQHLINIKTGALPARADGSLCRELLCCVSPAAVAAGCLKMCAVRAVG